MAQIGVLLLGLIHEMRGLCLFLDLRKDRC